MLLNERNIIYNKIKDSRLLLKEYISRNDIYDAIKEKEVIKIYYQGDNTVNRGYRTIEPHVIGKNSKGEILIRAWQQAGSSDTKKSRPEKWGPRGWWRLFKLSGISSVIPTGREFIEFPDKMNTYRDDGDSQMVEILMQVNYSDGAGYKVNGLDSIDDPDTVIRKVKDFDSEHKGKDEIDSEEYLKGIINNLYDMVKKSYKERPEKYFVVKQGNKYYVRTKIDKYDEKDVLGGLVDLARKLNNIEPEKKLPTSFIDNARNKFKANVKRRKK